MLEKTSPRSRELGEIGTSTDTRDILAHATRQSERFDDWFLVDVDAHVTETQFWPEILAYVDNDVIRHMGQAFGDRPVSRSLALLNNVPGMSYQSVYGRIPHELARLEPTAGEGCHPCVALVRRAMDAMGLDYQVLFPTPMLTLGTHPQDDVEAALAGAFNKWMIERILPEDERIKGLVYLPFNTPEACEALVEQYAGRREIIGYTVCSTRNKPVHHNAYMRLYAMIEESGKPLTFHTGLNWTDPSFSQLNRFVSMHALSFPHYNMIHLTNWVINGLPERFPRLKVVWIEGGDRLDSVPDAAARPRVHDARLRGAAAQAAAERLHARDVLHDAAARADNLELLEAVMKAINADTQLLFASDWPHWDFDPPRAITTLPFLGEQAKRNILGLNAARVFGLEVKRMRPAPRDVLASRPSATPA